MSQDKPKESWREMYEKMGSPIEKFQYLCGLKELSWHDCQDAWFESQKIMPDIAKFVEQERALRLAAEEKLAIAVETLQMTFKQMGRIQDTPSQVLCNIRDLTVEALKRLEVGSDLEV